MGAGAVGAVAVLIGSRIVRCVVAGAVAGTDAVGADAVGADAVLSCSTMEAVASAVLFDLPTHLAEVQNSWLIV